MRSSDKKNMHGTLTFTVNKKDENSVFTANGLLKENTFLFKYINYIVVFMSV